MKKLFYIFLVLLLLLSVACQNEKSVPPSQTYTYNIRATINGFSAQEFWVIAIIDEKREIVSKSSNGFVTMTSDIPLKQVCCLDFCKSGTIDVDDGVSNIVVDMEEIPLPVEIKNVKTIGTFGVYSTDGNGDVSFRYIGSFQEYFCTSWLPWLGISTNPNDWDGWDLTDWLPTWEGKKLLVPTRYQSYHQLVYGYSISNALFLSSIY